MRADDIPGDVREVLYTEAQLRARLAELARDIEADYAGETPLLVGVLKGAVMVVSDLARELRIPVHMDWMAVSSYGSGTTSSGVVRILKDLDADITGRRVLIVEDIIDSGLTLTWLKANLESRGPASVEICTLLRKPARLKAEIDLRYVGFDVPDEFVVGYGLDYDEQYRHLRDIVVLEPHVYSSQASPEAAAAVDAHGGVATAVDAHGGVATAADAHGGVAPAVDDELGEPSGE